jgi:hypothetical protein
MAGAAVAGAGTHAAGTWCEDTGCTTPLLRGAGMVSTWTRGQEQADKCALTTPANDQCCYMQHAWCMCAADISSVLLGEEQALGFTTQTSYVTSLPAWCQ